MCKSTIVFSMALTFMICAPAIAQQRNAYREYAAVQRAGGNVTVDANDTRPLMQALNAVTEEYGWTVDYEDPPYQSSLELVDATDPKWRAAHPQAPGVRSIRGAAFRTTYAETAGLATSAQDRTAVIRKVVADYNASGNPGQFEVREFAGHIAIVGVSVKDEAGQQLRVAPVLDTPVAVPSGSMNAGDAVVAILAALSSKTGKKVLPGLLPGSLMMQTQVTLPGTEMPARDALRAVLAQAKIDVSWRLLYDADMGAHAFSVLLARRVEYDTFGKRQAVLIRKR